MTIALTRAVPATIVDCELTHIARTPIDWVRAKQQHADYEATLRALGCTVQRLPELPDHPDSVFVEDAAVVFDECAVITRPGALSRRDETESAAAVLGGMRKLHRIAEPGTIDGGDVLLVGRRVYVGISTRTNRDGARQLADALSPYGYETIQVEVRNCLHLKSAATALPDGRVIVDPDQIDPRVFRDTECVTVHAGEPAGANVLAIDQAVLVPVAAPRTRWRLEAEGFNVVPVDASELAKAEGALTCCSLVLRE
ncbi:MAG TPA: arginine deiminase family protein [Gemmatimonadaceae bacterium]|nr:arginine deiminase family protein [Gemmatimonadaceae bacterium]